MKITIKKLKKVYGEKIAVDIPDCQLQAGEIIGLIGNNGAGKTTLFRLLLDLLKPDSGNVCIGSVDVSKSEEWKKQTGAYLDDSFLIDYLTPEEYFYFIGKMCGLDKTIVYRRLKRFERFMNGEILGQKKYIRNLSAGNKQKTGIIAGMLNHPDTVVLDEPFNFLDPTSQSALKHLLREYHEEMHATILISSHNLNHTIDISTRIMLMEHGQIIRDLTNIDKSTETTLQAYFNIDDTL